MKISILFKTFLLSCFLSPMLAIGMQALPMPKLSEQFDASKLKEDDLASIQFIEEHLNSPGAQMEFLNAVLKEVEQLSEEEQKQFWAAVEEETVRLNDAFVPQPQTSPTPQPMPAPAPTPIKPAPAPEPVKPVTDAAKIEDLVRIINNLINKLETILKKFQIISDFDMKFSMWSGNREIKSIPNGIQFSEIKKQTQQLIQKLSELKAHDVQSTRDYKYMSALLKNELLVNNLKQVAQKLNTYEPKIQVADFNLDTDLNPVSKDASIQVLNTLGEIFYRLGIPAAIDAIFTTYEARSKGLRDAKDASIKTAQQQSKTHRVISPVVSGESPKAPTYKQPQYRDRSLGGASTPSIYEALPEVKMDAPKFAGSPSSSGSSASAPSSSAKSKDSESKKSSSSVSDDKKKDNKDDAKKDKKDKDDSFIDEKKRAEKAFDRAENAIIKASESAASLNKLVPHLKSASAPINTGLMQAVSETTGLIKRAQDGVSSAKSFSKKLKPESKTSIVKYMENEARPLKRISDTISTLLQDESSIAPDKRYAFLGIKSASLDVKDPSIAIIEEPVSLQELKKSIDDLLRALKQF